MWMEGEWRRWLEYSKIVYTPLTFSSHSIFFRSKHTVVEQKANQYLFHYFGRKWRSTDFDGQWITSQTRLKTFFAFDLDKRKTFSATLLCPCALHSFVLSNTTTPQGQCDTPNRFDIELYWKKCVLCRYVLSI